MSLRGVTAAESDAVPAVPASFQGALCLCAVLQVYLHEMLLQSDHRCVSRHSCASPCMPTNSIRLLTLHTRTGPRLGVCCAILRAANGLVPTHVLPYRQAMSRRAPNPPLAPYRYPLNPTHPPPALCAAARSTPRRRTSSTCLSTLPATCGPCWDGRTTPGFTRRTVGRVGAGRMGEAPGVHQRKGHVTHLGT